MIKRRSAIEPAIGCMKTDRRLGGIPLKGSEGDALHAMPCGAGHNIRQLPRWLRCLRPNKRVHYDSAWRRTNSFFNYPDCRSRNIALVYDAVPNRRRSYVDPDQDPVLQIVCTDIMHNPAFWVGLSSLRN